ncbi:MAG: hypothetical protein KAY22_19340 [Rhizorhabdus sp.]|uniref:hypothetical protein n=1 Tax=Rhizorhabdus sp. TaxID=1968843 RepID=UPI001B44A8EF|nr:hypothetical protein [Rhizorhabdus sp.]MBP8234453.1 hypothetical protein [Rhizorhabdus sp.]
MAVLIPSSPGPGAVNPAYLDWGGVLRSPLGGADQKLNRLGDRFAIDVTMNTMASDDEAAAWVAALIKGKKEGAIFPWPQTIDVDGTGDGAVDGAGQAGTTLNIRGVTTGRKFKAGQMVSVVHGGRRYLHMLMAAGTASSAGKIALSIEPMMRVSYADGAVVEIDTPKIEGFTDGNSQGWSVDVARNVGLQFRITEAE